MKIDANELRQRINKLHSEMGQINKKSVEQIIEKLVKQEQELSEVCEILNKL